MKLFCKDYHWAVVKGQLILNTPTGKADELSKQVITTLTQQIRNQIAQDILNWNPVANRKEIVKRAGSLDAALLGVQAICADIATGAKDASRPQD